MGDSQDELPISNALVDINDVRTQVEFKGTSFSNFKKTDVRKQFIENMKRGKLEQSCYWCAELICAGHYLDVWDIILHYFGKHIHIGNPKMIIYLEMRYSIFKSIMTSGQFISEIHLRNNSQLRKLFAEIVSVLTISNKTHSFEPIKINRTEEFDLTQMSERLKAPNTEYATPIFLKEDPKELFIAINEFAYQLSKEASNTLVACYWIEWVIEFDLICKKKKQPCFCERRTSIQVEGKFQRDIIWLLWDSLFYTCGKRQTPFLDKLMKSLHEIFCIKYTTAAAKKRRYLLYLAVSLVTQTVPTNIELINDKKTVQNIIDRIDTVYKQIKKNEIAPKTDYLFNNLDKERKLEVSMMKMNLVNKADFANK